jgi:DNA polymerase-1
MPPTLYHDGHALAYLAYFALTRGTSSFTTRSGEPTAGVFGFTSILLRLFEHEKPEYLAVAFDTGKTFRDQLYPEYKGTRAKMPDDLRPQIQRIRQLLDAFHIPRLEVEGMKPMMCWAAWHARPWRRDMASRSSPEIAIYYNW